MVSPMLCHWLLQALASRYTVARVAKSPQIICLTRSKSSSIPFREKERTQDARRSSAGLLAVIYGQDGKKIVQLLFADSVTQILSG